MNIRPTLFIGLGSSGIEIIKEFRRFMFEQFSMAGLPIIGYIGLETDADFKVSDDLLPETFSLDNYENIQMIPCVVAGATAVQGIRGPELDKWLDRSILTNEWAIQKGAGSVRMNGRLALWMHAGSVALALLKKHGDITSQQATADTSNILASRAGGAFAGVQIDNGYDVYVLGTLCGGTSGGMFCDIAYLVQRLFNLGDVYVPGGMMPHTPGIYGIFTIIDTGLCLIPENNRKAANCWASLLELDHYMDPETEYDYNLPNTPQRDPTTNSPFSVVQLVSRQNLLQKQFHCDAPALYAGEDVNIMVALKIFNNIFSGLDRVIAAGTVDGVGGRIQGQLQRNDQLRTQSLISFGVSALWNPRYQFAEAFACTHGQEFCTACADHSDPARNDMLNKLARSEWKHIRDQAKLILMNVPGGANVRAALDTVVRAASGQLDNQTLGSLPGLLSNYPNQNSFGKRLEESGDLWLVMSNQVQNAKNYLITQVQNVLDQMSHNLDPSSQDRENICSLPEFNQFIAFLSHAIQQDHAICPAGTPVWRYQPVTFPPKAESLSHSKWLNMLGVAGQGISAAKQRIHQDWESKLESFMKETRRYFLGPLLADLLTNVIPNYQNKINGAISNLSTAKSRLQGSLEVVKKNSEREFENVVKIMPYPDINTYVPGVTAMFKRSGHKPRVVQDIIDQWQRTDNAATGRWVDLFLVPPPQLAELIRSSFARWALDEPSARIDLAKAAMDRYGTTDLLEDLAKWSFPFVLMRGGVFNPQNYARPVDHICGSGNIGALQTHIAGRDQHLSYKTFQSPLDNMVIFYRQMAPFFADDLHVTQDLIRYYNALANANLHTHYRQSLHFDKQFAFRQKQAKDKLWAIQQLYPNAIFTPREDSTGTRYRFSYMDTRGVFSHIDATKVDGQDKLCEAVAQDTPNGAAAKQKFNQDVKTCLEKNGKNAVVDSFNTLKEQWADDVSHRRITDREEEDRVKKIEKLINELFGSN